MTYDYIYKNFPLFWVSYRGTSNGAYIRASSHNDAKWIYANGEGLKNITYLKSKKA
jgi:hypothetical protein